MKAKDNLCRWASAEPLRGYLSALLAEVTPNLGDVGES